MNAKNQILPIKLDDGRIVHASVTMLGGEEEVAARSYSFSGAVDTIESIAKQLTKVFETAKPQKATVEFGVKLSAGSGLLTAFLVDAKGDASLTITLEWAAAK